MKYVLKSKKSYQLSMKEIKEICILKDSHYKFGTKSQNEWFRAHIKRNDIHNVILNNSELVGYTCLRKKNVMINKIPNNYLRFDTLIIKRNYRKKGLSSLLMTLNNQIIKNNNMLSFLLCNKSVISFYKKCNWKILNSSKYNLFEDKTKKSIKKTGMIFNNKKNKYKYFFLS
tara:strand:- start:2919 stop:3434 length:516 start_codon:yes stop_codon:yes gene_type:complete